MNITSIRIDFADFSNEDFEQAVKLMKILNEERYPEEFKNNLFKVRDLKIVFNEDINKVMITNSDEYGKDTYMFILNNYDRLEQYYFTPWAFYHGFLNEMKNKFEESGIYWLPEDLEYAVAKNITC